MAKETTTELEDLALRVEKLEDWRTDEQLKAFKQQMMVFLESVPQRSDKRESSGLGWYLIGLVLGFALAMVLLSNP